MARERDEESGKYRETYPPSQFTKALDDLGGAASTQEIAEKVGCAYRTAYAKLTDLDEKNQVNSKRVGNARLWQLPK